MCLSDENNFDICFVFLKSFINDELFKTFMVANSLIVVIY